MKFIIALLFALTLAACNQDASIIGSAAPQGTYASEANGGRTTYTFKDGMVRYENPALGVMETTFQMDGDVAKFQFAGGMPVGLKRIKEGVLVHSDSGTKFIKK